MTVFQIEVQAVAERYDVQAQQLARQILHLQRTHLPSLVPLSATSTPLNPLTLLAIRTAHLYRLTGNLSSSQVDQLISQLLVDPVVQQARYSLVDAPLTDNPGVHVIDVFFHPGVTDTLAESVLAGAHMLGITGLEQVETGRRYLLDARLTQDEARTIADALLYNPVIQHYVLHGIDAPVGSDLSRLSPRPPIYRPASPDLSHPSPIMNFNDPGRYYHASLRSASLSPASETLRFAQGDNTLPMFGVKNHYRPPATSTPSPCTPTSFPLSGMSDEQLLALSKEGMLALNLDEMHAIQQYYQEQGRDPTDVELETLAQTWSEHCSHKTFKATIHYREKDSAGNVLEEETIAGLLKSYLVRATESIRPPWLVSAFTDNAGIVRFTPSQDIAFKVETHNHPSAIEPFGGANTGIGGVIRDVLGVSAQPVACTDILCFGPPDMPIEELPAGILSPRRIASGVVNGIRDYGNKMGIPTVNGAILYHEGYIYNPLVFCGCLGILRHGSHPRTVQPGDKIVVLGGRTGRDGIHGATFSSGEMSSEMHAQAGSAVQIGAPITEKKVADVIIQARDRQLYSAITDCGAGGFSSAMGEMGAETGAHVELAHAPLKYQGLAPWEIWLSEAQERMVLAVPPQHLEELLAICAIEEVEASILGTFTDDHRLVVTYNGQTVADLDMTFLHEGRPARTLEALWIKNETPINDRRGEGGWDERGGPLWSPAGEVEWSAPAYLSPDRPTNLPSATGDHEGPPHPSQPPSPLQTGVTSSVNMDLAQFGHSVPPPQSSLLSLLRHPTIASKESVVRRYDHEVQGATVLKPLVGRAGNGPGDAAVLQPILNEPSTAGIVLSNGINPLYGKIDPYHMAMNAVDEALRNLTAVGGDIERAAILDNFCWGNPTDPIQLGMLVRAIKGCHDAAVGFGVPFISGKDSLNNEYRRDGQRIPVIPTLLISAISVIDDAAQTIDMSLKAPGNLLYQIGATRNELAGSHYLELAEQESTIQPKPRGMETSKDPGLGQAQPLPSNRGGQHAEGRGDPCGRPVSHPPPASSPRPASHPRPTLPDVVKGTVWSSVPHVDIPHARTLMQALSTAIRKGLVRACHDLSEGGLAVAAAEMSLAGLLGLTIDVGKLPAIVGEVPVDTQNLVPNSKQPNETPINIRRGEGGWDGWSGPLWSPGAINTILLFSESASRFLVEIAPEQREAFESQMQAHGVADVVYIGKVNETDRFVVRNGDEILIDLPVSELQEAWKGEEA